MSLVDSCPEGVTPAWGTLPELFSRVVQKSGEQPALLMDGHSACCYQKLDELSNQIAHMLLRSGASHQCRVGVCGERSQLVIAALLGILKAGAVYVPLDPAYPAERLQFIAADAQLDFLLVDSIGEDRLTSLEHCHARRLALSASGEESTAPVTVPVSEHDLAYIMYTSGSTGTPKGVAVEHRSIVRLVLNPNYVTLSPRQRILHLAPLSFDASTFEIWGALLNGAALILAPHDLPLKGLAELIVDWHVDTLWLTSGYFNVLVGDYPESLKDVKQLLAGGDVLSPRHVSEALFAMEDGVVINGYGPTENTTFTCCHRVRLSDTSNGAIPIGIPINGTEVYLLDEDQRIVPVGKTGELHIAGVGLAREYWQRPELTSRAFIPVEVEPGVTKRLYRSGDLARYNDAGELEFLGRKDNQLKIRGFRVEPEEIERTLEASDDIQAAAVVAKGSSADEKRLCCYFVPKCQLFTGADVKAYLSSRLPKYLVPTEFVSLEALPLTVNGKLDREELKNRLVTSSQQEPAYRDSIEHDLAEIWKTILGITSVGVDDDFFQLGGHSLAAARMFSLIDKKFGKVFPLVTAMQAPTVRKLAVLIRGAELGKQSPSLVSLSDSAGKTPFFTLHATNGNVLGYKKIAHRLRDFSVFDVRLAIEEEPSEQVVSVEQHAAEAVKMIREQQPNGPYFLAGYSAYGVLAFEVARQLRMSGHSIGSLILLDSHIDANFQSLVRNKRYFAASGCLARTLLWNFRLARKAGYREYLSQRFPSLVSSSDPSQPKDNGDRPDCGHVSQSLLIAIGAYRPMSFDCAGLLFKTPESDEYNPKQSLAWSRLLLSGLEVFYLSGTHFTLFIEPHLSMLVEKLNHGLQGTSYQRAA